MSFVIDNIIMFIGMVILLLIINLVILKKYYITIMDEAFIRIVMLSLIIADVVLLYFNDVIIGMEFFKNIILTYLYFGVICVLGKLFSKSKIVDNIRCYIKAPERGHEVIVFWMIYGMAFLSTLYFSYSMIGANMGDERIVLAAQNRVVDILRNGSSMIPFMAVLLWLKLRERKYIVALFIFAIVSMFGGSKGVLFAYINLYVLYRYIVKKEISRLELMSIFIIGFLGMLFTLSLFGRSIDSSLDTILMRVAFPGDTYLFAYVWGDYHQLDGQYNAIDYIMHPFYRLIGERGYEYPFGVALNGIVKNNYDGYGPNALLPILSSALSDNIFFGAMIIVSFMGMISVVIVILSIKVKAKNEFMNIFITISLYYSVLVMFTEIGLWEQKIISLLIVCGIVEIFLGIYGYCIAPYAKGGICFGKNNNHNSNL